MILMIIHDNFECDYKISSAFQHLPPNMVAKSPKNSASSQHFLRTVRRKPTCSPNFGMENPNPSGPIPHLHLPLFVGDIVPSLGKGYGKGAFGAPKEAKGLVRAVVSAQVVPGGKWNNDDNTSPGRDGGMGGWGMGDGGKGRHIHIYIIYIYHLCHLYQYLKWDNIGDNVGDNMEWGGE